MDPSIELFPFYNCEGDTFVAIGRVCECHCAISLQWFIGETFPASFSKLSVALDCSSENRKSFSCTLYLHGWVSNNAFVLLKIKICFVV